MSSMVSDEPWDEEDDAPELDIGGAPRVDLGWEMAQASNDDRGTRCVRRFFLGGFGGVRLYPAPKGYGRGSRAGVLEDR